MTDPTPAKAAVKQVESVADEMEATVDKTLSDMPETLQSGIPESFRALAENAANQTRDSYERAKGTMEEAIQAWEKSFDAYGAGASAFSQKLMEITRENMNAGLDVAKKLSRAKDMNEFIAIQSDFLRQQLTVFADQAGEIRALSAKLAEDASAPIRNHVERSFESFRQSA